MTRNNMFSISSPPDFSVSSSFYPFHTRSLHLGERQGRRIRRPAGKMKEPRQHRPVFLSSSLCPIPVSLPSFMMCMFLTLSASCLHPLMAQVSSGVSHHRFLRSSSSSSTATSSSSSSGGIIIRNHSLFPTLPSSCPANCVCDATPSQKKRVSCTKGSLKQIPTDKMDEDTKVSKSCHFLSFLSETSLPTQAFEITKLNINVYFSHFLSLFMNRSSSFPALLTNQMMLLLDEFLSVFLI